MIEYIPKGKSERISSSLLSVLTNKSEREMRKKIEELRKTEAIMSSVDTFGYWLPTEDEAGVKEAEAFIRQRAAVAKSYLRSCKGAQAFIERVTNKNISVWDLLDEEEEQCTSRS